MKTTIKSVTNCPTCGSECKVEGDSETHFYVPKNKYTEEDLREAFKQSRQAKVFEDKMPSVYENFDDWFNEYKKK